MQEKYCLVTGCRYPDTHLTQSHRCPCGIFGHGQIECTDQYKMNQLRHKVNQSNIEFPARLYCTIPGCKKPNTHTNSSHICRICGDRDHSITNCLYNNNILPRRRTLYEINDPISPPPHPGPPPVPSSPKNPSNPAKPESKPKKEVYKIKCPSCRAENIIPISQKLTVGHNLECIVCFGNANIFLPTCGHINICLDCVKEIDNKKSNNENIDQIDQIDQINLDMNINNRLPIEPLEIVTQLGENQGFNFHVYPGDNINELKARANDVFGNRDGKLVLRCYAGMGCDWYIKRNSLNSDVEIFFMHGDNWGQYGQLTSDVGRLNEFISECIPILNDNNDNL